MYTILLAYWAEMRREKLGAVSVQLTGTTAPRVTP